jgi:hypothetical protein
VGFFIFRRFVHLHAGHSGSITVPTDKHINPAAPQPLPQQEEHAGEEQQILREISAALKSIRFGSIVLTIHEGRLVEITKTVRSRYMAK